MKVLLARKFLTNNPFTKNMQHNIDERWSVYHEDFKKMNEVKEKLRKKGYEVKIYEVVEEKK